MTMDARTHSSLADPRRLRVLRTTQLLDTPPEAAFDRATRLASTLLGTPIAVVSLLDAERQFFKSAVGLPEELATRRETPVEESFCQYVVAESAPFIVSDARGDERVRDSAAVTAGGVGSYLGVPLRISSAPIGALCVVDSRPRSWTEDQIETLRDLAAFVVTEMEQRLQSTFMRLLQSVAAAANRSATAEDAMQICLEQVCAMTGWPVGHVYLRRDAAVAELVPTEIWSMQATSRFEAFRRATQDSPLAAGVGLPGQVLATGTPIWLADVEWAENFPRRAAARASELRAGFAFPVLIGSEVAAVLEFYSERAEAPDPLLLEIMQQVGEELGRAVERARNAEALRASEAQRRQILDRAYDAFVAIDAAGIVTDWNLQAEATFGWSRSEATGRPIAELIIPPQHREAHSRGLARFLATGAGPVINRRLELVALHRDGHELPVESTITPIGHGGSVGFAAFMHDISDRKAAASALQRQAEELRALSLTDELTRLHNRRGFLTLVEQQLKIADRSGTPLFLFYADLDGLKRINDQLGHQWGDRAIFDGAEVLRKTFRAADIIARLGGDEFAALLVGGPSDHAPIMTRLEANIAAVNAVVGRRYVLAMSTGIVVYDPAKGETLEELLARADATMYEQKRARKEAAVA